MQPTNISHLIFALAGADPSKLLAAAPAGKNAIIKGTAAAVVTMDHQKFIETVFPNGPEP